MNQFMLLWLVVNVVGISWIASRVVISLQDRGQFYSHMLDTVKYVLAIILIDSIIFGAGVISSGEGV